MLEKSYNKLKGKKYSILNIAKTQNRSGCTELHICHLSNKKVCLKLISKKDKLNDYMTLWKKCILNCDAIKGQSARVTSDIMKIYFGTFDCCDLMQCFMTPGGALRTTLMSQEWWNIKRVFVPDVELVKVYNFLTNVITLSFFYSHTLKSYFGD